MEAAKPPSLDGTEPTIPVSDAPRSSVPGAAFIDAEKILSWGSGDRLLQVWNHRTGELCLAIEVNKEPSQAGIENSGGTELDAMFEMALGDDDELADELAQREASRAHFW